MLLFPTPLRYPGGKGRLTQFLGGVIEMNGLADGHYVEPYAGGAGAALGLLFLEHVRRIHLNDISRSVYAFWHSAVKQPEALCRMIAETPATVAEWRRQQQVQKHATKASHLELGFSTLFLNRTSRSGILDAGIIGGKRQTGAWKIGARYNRKALIGRIERIARYSHRISIYRFDAARFIREVLPNLPLRTLVYLDPPYFVKGKGLYEDHYQPSDHAAIAALVQERIRQRWLMSYDNAPEIDSLYRERRKQVFSLHYSANDRFYGKEVMILSDGLAAPDEIIPSRSVLHPPKPHGRRHGGRAASRRT